MEEIKLPPQLPQAPPELPADMVSQIDKFLSNPLFAIGVKGHVEDIQQFIKENAGEFEPLVYDYIKSKYPNIFAIIQPEDVKEEVEREDKDKGEEEEPVKPVPQAAITYEILELHKELYTPSEIADILSEKYDINLYAMHVGRIIKRAEAAALAAQNKPQDKPEIKQVIQVTRTTQTPTENSTPKQIDPDMMLVVSSAASLINFWNKIKIYIYMTLAAIVGAIIQKTIIMR